MYNIEITFHQGSEREFSIEETYLELEMAVCMISHHSKGNTPRAWINNREVRVKNGAVLGADGDPFCTNQVWHDLYAPNSYPKITPIGYDMRPPLNPATYAAMGKPL